MLTINIRTGQSSSCFLWAFPGEVRPGAGGPGPPGPAADREPPASGGRTHPSDSLCSISSCHFNSFPGGLFEIHGTLYTAVQIASRSQTAAIFMARMQQMLYLKPTSFRHLPATFFRHTALFPCGYPPYAWLPQLIHSKMRQERGGRMTSLEGEAPVKNNKYASVSPSRRYCHIILHPCLDFVKIS